MLTLIFLIPICIQAYRLGKQEGSRSAKTFWGLMIAMAVVDGLLRMAIVSSGERDLYGSISSERMSEIYLAEALGVTIIGLIFGGIFWVIGRCKRNKKAA